MGYQRRVHGTCCCVTFCNPCAIYKTANDLGQSGILYVLLGCILPCVPVMLLRTRRGRGTTSTVTLRKMQDCPSAALHVFSARQLWRSRRGGTLKSDSYC